MGVIKHTPTPWATSSQGYLFQRDYDPLKSPGFIRLRSAWAEGAWDGDETAAENATFVAQAVNSYEAMRSALQRVLDYVEDETATRVLNQCTLCFTYRKIVRDALAIADASPFADPVDEPFIIPVELGR